jgi:citrate lyase subunit beta/citryl-CoA lyase
MSAKSLSGQEWNRFLIDSILYDSTHSGLCLPACDHYAGTYSRIEAMLIRQEHSTPSFDITADCEDGAAVGYEEKQLATILHFLSHPLRKKNQQQGHRFGVRVHDAGHSFFEKELSALLTQPTPPDYLVLPKIVSLSDLEHQIRFIESFETLSDKNQTEIHVIIETHGGLKGVFEIAAHPRVSCLSFGIMDFVSAHCGVIPHVAMKSPLQFDHPLLVRAKTEIAAAAAMFGKVASHNVCVRLDDPKFAFEDAVRAYQRFGFSRMWSIHPSQIEPIQQAFLINNDALSLAQGIITQATYEDFGPIRFEQQLHDRASFRYHWMLVKKAYQQGLSLEPFIQTLFSS